MLVVNASTSVDSAVPPRDPKTSQALEPSQNLSWYRSVIKKSALVEHLYAEALEEEEIAADLSLPLPAGSIQTSDNSFLEVEQQSHHSEPVNNVQEILLEALHNASYQ